MDTCSKPLPDKKDPLTMATHKAFSHTQSNSGPNRTRSNKSPTCSLDSGIYVHMDINFDDSPPSTELEDTKDQKESIKSAGPQIYPQPETQDKNGELAEKDLRVQSMSVMSDPDLVTGIAEGLKSSTSAVIHELDNTNALMSLSMLAIPPPLPPKSPHRSPASKNTLSQGPEIKDFIKEKTSLNSVACQTSPILGGVKGNNQFLPDMHNNCKFGILPKVEPKCPPQPPLRPPPKPPRLNKPKTAEAGEGNQRCKQEAERRKHKENTVDTRNKQEQDLTERNKKKEENKETFRTESQLDLGKPLGQILVLFTDREKGGGERKDRGKEDEGPSNTGLTAPNMTENSSLLPLEGTAGMVATNNNCASTVSAKLEPIIQAQPPPKPQQKCPPKPPFKPPQLFSTMKAGMAEEEKRRKQENEQCRDKDSVEERDENEGEGNGRGQVNRDPRNTGLTTPTVTEMSQLGETVMESIPEISENQEVKLLRGGQRFCLMPPCRNSPTPVITVENQTLPCQSQHPCTQHHSKANGQVKPGPLPQEVPACVNPQGTDSKVETFKGREKGKEILISGHGVQDSTVMSELLSGDPEGAGMVRTNFSPCQQGLERLEGTQETAWTLPDGEPKQTNQRPNAREKVKNLAKKVMCKLKEGKEEKRRTKVEGMEPDGVRESHTEMTQDGRRLEGEGGMKADDEEEQQWMDDDAMDQSAVTKTQSHADLREKRVIRRNATSESLYHPFGSFKVCIQVKLVEELLSGDDWSKFLHRNQSATPDPPSNQIHSEDTAQPSVNLQFNSSAELDLNLDVFEGNPAAPEEEPVYEDIDVSSDITESQEMRRAPFSAIPKILLESDTDQMSPTTKHIYDTVEFIQPVQPANTIDTFSDVKSQLVLDSSVQKYLIKLSKKRKHKAARKRHWDRRRETHSQAPSSTVAQQVFPASIFYNVPAAGEEEQQPPAPESGGSSPRCMAKLKMALKDKTMLRSSQPKEDR